MEALQRSLQQPVERVNVSEIIAAMNTLAVLLRRGRLARKPRSLLLPAGSGSVWRTLRVCACVGRRLRRDSSQAVRGGEASLLAMVGFTEGTLWPLLRQVLARHALDAEVVERALRCMKHAVRIGGSRMQSLVADLFEVLMANSQVRKRKTNGRQAGERQQQRKRCVAALL